jgi:Acetyltransferase (GNAT) family.
MPEPIVISAASGPEDVQIIEALAREIWTPHYTPIIGAAQIGYMLENFQSRAAIAADMQKGYIYSLAYLNGAPCGYSALRFDPDALFLSKLYVREAFRGKGIARAMVLAAEAAAREHGKACLRLTCNKRNTGSLAAYDRLGFARTADVVTDIGGGFVMDDYVMEKRLADAAQK